MLGTKRSSMMNFLIQIASPPLQMMYLTSVVKSIVVSYLRLFQLTTLSFKAKKHILIVIYYYQYLMKIGQCILFS